MKSIIAIIMSIMLLVPSTVMASRYTVEAPALKAVSPMKEGQKAPFDGILYSTAAAAQVQVDLENAEDECNILRKRDLDTQAARHELSLANEKAAREAAQKQLDQIVIIKNDQIQFLTKEIERNQKKNKFNWGPVWLASGVVGGILITIGAGYALGQIGNIPNP
jgi:hypothetical protein